MSAPKISVIIPVYKAEAYLRRCLDSVAGQTYRNLEILLVDDGSPDNSGAICDGYAAANSRFRVIHKPNGGVSSARNAGLAAAEGDWIGWVDADDWIEPDMFAYLLTNAEKEDADIAVCGRWEQYPDRSVARGWTERQLLPAGKAMAALLENDAMQNYLWDKLYRRELFEGLCFPEGRTYEDIALVYRLFERSERILCLPDCKYHYFQHAESIVKDASLGNRLHYYRANYERYLDLGERRPELLPKLEEHCAMAVLGIWCSYCSNDRAERRACRSELEKIAEDAKNYQWVLKKLGLAGRAIAPLTVYSKWWAFASAGAVSWLYRLRHGETL